MGDMAEDMQQDAIDCATQALEKYNIEKDIAAFIKKEFDKKYNPTWHCIVGATSVRMSHTKRSTSSTSTLARWPSCCSSRVSRAGRDNADMPHRLGVVMQCSVYSSRAHHGK